MLSLSLEENLAGFQVFVVQGEYSDKVRKDQIHSCHNSLFHLINSLLNEANTKEATSTQKLSPPTFLTPRS